jgi:hypothetical protein
MSIIIKNTKINFFNFNLKRTKMGQKMHCQGNKVSCPVLLSRPIHIMFPLLAAILTLYHNLYSISEELFCHNYRHH